MRLNPRLLICTLSFAIVTASAGPVSAAAKRKQKPAAVAKDAKAAKSSTPAKAQPAKDEQKGPARFSATMSEDIELDAKADKKRDEQIEQLKRIIPKVQGTAKADLLFQLAELWWEKSKFVRHAGVRKWDEAYAAWLEKANRGEEAGVEPRLEVFTREGELYRQEALRKYEEILKEYPAYERKDEVLFAFAYNKYEIGQKEEAIEKYNELIKQYPDSRFVPDAYVQMGEHFFNTNQLVKARTAFDKALATNNAKIKYFALYKLAWCDYNGGAYEEAVKKFKEVIAHSKANKGGTGLKNEALNDIVISFAQIDAVDEAMEYFKKNTGKANSRRLTAKLAGLFQESGKHESAIRVFRTLISDDVNDARCPEYQNAIVTSYEGLRNREMVKKEMKRLVDLYNPNSPWAKANSANKNAISAAYDMTENAMRTMVTEYHQEAQKTKVVETYRLARDIYKEYLDNFSDSEFAYNLRFYYAEILWALNEYESAAPQYAMVVDKDKAGQYSKMAGYNEVLCYEKLVDIERGKAKKVELKEGQKIDEKRRKDEIKKTTVKLERHDKDAKEEEIPPFQMKLVTAIDRYVTIYPGADDEITVRYKAAFVFYDHKHDLEAAKRFGEIIAKWPTDQWSRRAADLSLDILNQKQEWFELNRLAREFHANKKLAGSDKDFATRIADLVEASQYMYIDEVVYKKEQRPAEAAVKFREFVAEFPKSKYSPQALLYAMVIHSEAKELDKSIEVGEKLLAEYPDAKTTDGKDLVARTVLYLGSFYEQTADFATSARFYERYVNLFLGEPAKEAKKAKKDKKLEGELADKVADALFNAALWTEGLGDYDHAVALYSRYVTEFSAKKDVPEIYFKIGLVFERQKNHKDAAKIFKGYVEQYGKSVGAAEVFYAKYREWLALRELKQDRDSAPLMDELLKSYEKLSKEGQESDRVRNAYAHLRFQALAPLWREYKSVRFDQVRTLRKNLKTKLELKDKVEKAYTAVVAIGSVDWAVASLTRMGEAYEDFARNLLDSPDPYGLDEDQLFMYRSELENRAFPLEESAIGLYEKALEKSFELSVYSESTLEAQNHINNYKRGAFLEPRDVPYQGAQFFASAAAILDAPKPPPPPPMPAQNATPTPGAQAPGNQ
ncbi:MAG TPA: gliding motility protein U [Myxococcales bacterium]|jgi:TolA-binding protein|nr:gliding motility protein U [Myxococcales bacterium]